MFKNTWKKITAVGLAACIVMPSAVYARSSDEVLSDGTQSAALTQDYENAESDDTSESAAIKDSYAVLGDTAELAGGIESEERISSTLPFSWKTVWLNAIQNSVEVAIDMAEEKGLLDETLTSEGYDLLRDLAKGITDAKLRAEALGQVRDAAIALTVQVGISLLMPYILEGVRLLDSAGLGTDEIIELARLLPEEYQPVVNEVLAYTGVFGITDPQKTSYPMVYDGMDSTWAIYVYMAGNDLETSHWAATHDLEEIIQTRLPENVKVVMEAGGAEYWHNEYMDADYQNRCVYDSEGMHVISQTPRQNMGDQKTLEGFLDWCTSEYPADKTMLIFWGHGAATDGVCLDENNNNDSITLAEMKGAIDHVFGENREEPVFDMVGFDACLMASVDVASVCSEFASYMAASEDSEPGDGWAYHSILSQIAATPSVTMEQLGKLLCSSYLFNNAVYNLDDTSTFSYVDLEKAEDLIAAYDELGKAILERYREDPSLKEEILHIAADAETYASSLGIRSTNQIDLGDFANYLQPLFPEESRSVQDALEKCVIYMDNGSERDHSRGLSCMFPFSRYKKSLTFYKESAAGEFFPAYYEEAGYFTDEDETETETT